MSAVPEKAGCGSCTMCCKLLGIEELSKPPSAWCPSCDKGRGCQIYEARPLSCRDFACVWLVGAEDGRGADPALRPDRCHVVFHEPQGSSDSVIAHVDPAYPGAWREAPAVTRIAGWASEGITVAVSSAGRHWIVDGSGVHEARLGDPDAGGGRALEKTRLVGRLK